MPLLAVYRQNTLNFPNSVTDMDILLCTSFDRQDILTKILQTYIPLSLKFLVLFVSKLMALALVLAGLSTLEFALSTLALGSSVSRILY